MSAVAVISLIGVKKAFGALNAVDGVSLDLAEGEFFALLGPSGCGKTTLLRIIAGFEQPDLGTVLLDGRDVTRLRPNRRPVNLMFQSYALFPHMSVRANISYGLEMEGRPKAEITARVDEALAQTRLEAFADRRPDRLSGGQRQRVALARALVKRPRVLLLDEPLGALDKKLREHMQLELKRLQHELGITFVVVTHDQEEALALADRIALMKDGAIAQLGRPQELYERPASRFAADFLGRANFLEGEVANGGLLIAGHGLVRAEAAAATGTAASLAIRPERLALSAESPGGDCNALLGEVTGIAYHGQDLTVQVNVPGLAAALIARVPIADATAPELRAGQPVWCRWRPEHGLILVD